MTMVREQADSSNTASSESRQISGGELLAVAVVALVLGMFFWESLWSGGGLIGGDIYSYFFPQKVFFSDELRAGRIPLWNPRTGHGYPVLGESQTAILYPPNLVAYATMTVAESYGLLQLFHYILAFWWTWLYARQIGLSFGGAVVAAITFVYGWFPPRICLEWAIVTGAYFPLALWLLDRYLATRFWRYGIGLSAALGLQLLAGHYHIAFITHGALLAVALYTILRSSRAVVPDVETADQPVAGRFLGKFLLPLTAIVWILLGYGVASVQLVSTAELKGRSQRVTAEGREFDPGYGHIPPAYWSQVCVPWKWYRTGENYNQDDAIQTAKWLAIHSGTNKIEAHLYWGFASFCVMVIGTMAAGRRATRVHPQLIPWLVFGACALIYATGWLIPVARYIPGLNFFRGLGRYGLIMQWAGSLWLGALVTVLLQYRARWICALFYVIYIPIVVADLFIVSDIVTNAPQTPYSPVEFRSVKRSPVAQYFSREQAPARVFTPGPNVINIVGAGCVPPYLGIGPSEYYDPKYACPKSVEVAGQTPVVSREQIEWMQRMGITHVLSFEALRGTDLPLQFEWSGPDEVLNYAWARGKQDNFVYRVKNGRGRACWSDSSNRGSITFQHYYGDEVSLKVETPVADRLILTDLAYPGWYVWVDGRYIPDPPTDEMFRAVDVEAGTHEIIWRYRPQSVLVGGVISVISLVILAALGHVKFWYPQYFASENSASR